MSFVFREYQPGDQDKIKDTLINKKRLDKYRLKTLKYNLASALGLYRPCVYVLENTEDNNIIGMAVLVNRIDYSFRRMEWWIEALIVAEGQRKLGFGTMLMNHLCGVLRMKGAKKAFLNFESDNVIAKSFYKKQGFIPSKRIFGMYKRPFSSVSPPSKPSPLVPVRSKNEQGTILQHFFPYDHTHDNRWIGLYAHILTFLHLLVIKISQGQTAKGQVWSIASIYFYFIARVEIILPDMLDAEELEQIVRSEFLKFSLCAWRKIVINVICKGPNCDEWPCPQTLPQVSDVEDFVEFDVIPA